MTTGANARGVNVRISKLMRTLFLMRHAKSSWDDASLADFDRPLNARGERDAPIMGDLMRREGFSPGVIVSSPARRAKQTAEAAKRSAGVGAKITFNERIYEASPTALRHVAAGLSDNYSSAMLVGHNPGMEGLIRYLTGENEGMPTAAVAVINLNIKSWSEIGENCGKLKKIFRPKELTSL